MLTIADYMDTARVNLGVQSDRALSRALAEDPATVNRWRKGKGLPTDAQMVKLAQLAGVDDGEALLLLNTWRSRGTLAEGSYHNLVGRFRKAVVAVVAALAIGLVSLAPPAAAPAR